MDPELCKILKVLNGLDDEDVCDFGEEDEEYSNRSLADSKVMLKTCIEELIAEQRVIGTPVAPGETDAATQLEICKGMI